jgi:hypothetical protein
MLLLLVVLVVVLVLMVVLVVAGDAPVATAWAAYACLRRQPPGKHWRHGVAIGWCASHKCPVWPLCASSASPKLST